MHYREIQPGLSLRPFVECFWTLESAQSSAPSQPERILPDGCVELILNFGAQFKEHQENGQSEQQPFHFLVGQMTRPIVIAPTGRVELIGVRFHPGGTLPFFRIPMHEITNRVVELGALARNIEREVMARVAEEPSLTLKIAALEKLLVQRVDSCQHDSRLMTLAAKIVKSGGQVSLDLLARAGGVSSRHLERRFLRDVGVGPKMLCRILRFQQTFRAVDRNDPGWAAVAADCGYFDQAHLIRDFRQFAQQTPTVLLAQSSPLTAAFTRKERRSDFSNTLD